jgi:molecular chaperone GrpE
MSDDQKDQNDQRDQPDDVGEPTLADQSTPSPEPSDADIAAAVAAAEALNAAAALGPEEVLTLQRDRDDYLDSLRRLQADFDNYRKRSFRDQDAAADRAGEKVVNRLLPVLDTFELALTHESEPDGSPMAKLHDTLLGALESEGLQRLAPTGEPFDPATADAVMHEEGDGTSTGPTVSEVLRAGYVWKGRVIRPAMVKVVG